MLSLLLLVSSQQATPEALYAALRTSLLANDAETIEANFVRSQDSRYLVQMAKRNGGLDKFKLTILPVPPGWLKDAEYWAVFSKEQEIESDHDPIYKVVRTGDELKLGAEIPEWEASFAQLKHAKIKTWLRPERSEVQVSTTLHLKPYSRQRALVFRLNTPYRLRRPDEGQLREMEEGVLPNPSEGDLVRAGSLLIPWTRKKHSELSFNYDAVLPGNRGDHINETVAQITGWWVPSLGRLPHTTEVEVRAPSNWLIRSEGNLVSERAIGSDKLSAFRCDLPISYPKVMGGTRYVLVAELKDSDRTYRSWQLEPIDKARGEHDVKRMSEAVRFFEEKLAPFPFNGYECFDAQGFYGIESYSHTLLSKSITSRYVAHEIGHTYFGGIVPCAYVRDSWNEGATTYVEDVLTGRNADKPLDLGLKSIDTPVPLDKMAVAHEDGGHSYWRGAYIFKMLETEIGAENVLIGFRALLKDRVGKDTAWPDLRPYFERAGKKDLAWFWSQWVSGAVFPKLELLSAKREGDKLLVKVRQSGTPKPYRLRFKLKLYIDGGEVKETLVEMTDGQQEFAVAAPTVSSVTLDLLGYTLASKGEALEVGNSICVLH